jgi:hypothetical protein
LAVRANESQALDGTARKCDEHADRSSA